MFKKIMSLVLACVMIAGVCPGVMANDTTPAPSIEEILSDYHQKAFEAEMSGGENTPATYSRQSGSTTQTLEQQTVDTLNEAGYEAYNVTASNYDDLEDSLQTDFASMGLEQDGSYVVVISGENPDESAGNNSRAGSLIDQTIGDVEGASFFTYTYDGTTYKMRNITITAAENSKLTQTSEVDLCAKLGGASVLNVINYPITVFTSISDPFGVGTVFSILTTLMPDIEPTQEDSLDYRGSSNWTITYTQIYDTVNSIWTARSGVEYVTMRYFIDYTYYESSTNQGEQISKDGLYGTVYSEHYNDTEWRKEMAVLAYKQGLREYDEIDSVYYQFKGKTVLKHDRWMEYLGYEPCE